MTAPSDKEMWVDWTHDAMGVYSKPDELDEAPEIVSDMIDFATDFADGMLDELEDRFGGGKTKQRRKTKRKKPEDDDDEDND